MASEEQSFEKLKNVLFHEELEKQRELLQEIDELKGELAKARAQDTARQDPFVEEVVDRVAEVMPERLGPSITETLKVQIRESRNEVVDALYPILGRLIRKYVKQEVQALSERLDQQMDQMFNLENLWEYLKVKVLGLSPSTLALRKMEEPELKEIFVIEKNSGILIGSYSRNSTVDQDLIAGMLTAIKSFLEDAFSRTNDDLEVIQYESYKIHVKSYTRFYIAVVISGIYTQEFQLKVDELVDDFVEKTTSLKVEDIAPEDEEEFSAALENVVSTYAI